MFEAYRHLKSKYPKISIHQERRLIKQAQGRSKAKKNELIERHIWFVIFRINKIVFSPYRTRFGEDILSETIPVPRLPILWESTTPDFADRLYRVTSSGLRWWQPAKNVVSGILPPRPLLTENWLRMRNSRRLLLINDVSNVG